MYQLIRSKITNTKLATAFDLLAGSVIIFIITGIFYLSYKLWTLIA